MVIVDYFPKIEHCPNEKYGRDHHTFVIKAAYTQEVKDWCSLNIKGLYDIPIQDGIMTMIRIAQDRDATLFRLSW